jgi:hypothetical protein
LTSFRRISRRPTTARSGTPRTLFPFSTNSKGTRTWRSTLRNSN